MHLVAAVGIWPLAFRGIAMSDGTRRDSVPSARADEVALRRGWITRQAVDVGAEITGYFAAASIRRVPRRGGTFTHEDVGVICRPARHMPRPCASFSWGVPWTFRSAGGRTTLGTVRFGGWIMLTGSSSRSAFALAGPSR